MSVNWRIEMALYCIHAEDHPHSADLRLTHYDAHRAYLETATVHGIVIHASGPLVDEDGIHMIGSLFIMEAADEGRVATFNAADPFAKAGLWASVRIHRFHMRRGAFAPSLSP
jgi:uncharacterized protein